MEQAIKAIKDLYVSYRLAVFGEDLAAQPDRAIPILRNEPFPLLDVNARYIYNGSLSKYGFSTYQSAMLTRVQSDMDPLSTLETLTKALRQADSPTAAKELIRNSYEKLRSVFAFERDPNASANLHKLLDVENVPSDMPPTRLHKQHAQLIEDVLRLQASMDTREMLNTSIMADGLNLKLLNMLMRVLARVLFAVRMAERLPADNWQQLDLALQGIGKEASINLISTAFDEAATSLQAIEKLPALEETITALYVTMENPKFFPELPDALRNSTYLSPSKLLEQLMQERRK